MTFTLKWDSVRERANRRDKTGGSPGQWLDIYCARRRVEVVGETLPLGDYIVFWYTVPKILIERKTWDDLAGSIKTGHLDEQLGRMQRVREETGCTLVVLVEGRRRESHCHIESKNLQAKLDHIMFAGQANIVYTDSTEETVKRIYEMIDNLQVPNEPPQFAEANKVLTATKDHGPAQTLLDCFMAVPQLSLSTARILIDQHWNLWDLYEAEESTLAEITYPSGAKMGAARAKKIAKAMGERKTWVKILEQIQGVTKKTAELLFAAEADHNKWTENSIADVAKTEKSRVGPAVASRIVTALSYRKPK
jgi:ERCC4-type nuclease